MEAIVSYSPVVVGVTLSIEEWRKEQEEKKALADRCEMLIAMLPVEKDTDWVHLETISALYNVSIPVLRQCRKERHINKTMMPYTESIGNSSRSSSRMAIQRKDIEKIIKP